MLQPETCPAPRPEDQSWRGERLYPGHLHPRHYSLTRMREAFGAALGELDTTNGLRVLDYGCGNMPYRPLFEALCSPVSYQGADLPGNSLADVVIRPDGTLAADDALFDVVLSTQVLEHVSDPAVYLRESFRVLKPGGHLLISTHGYWMYHPDPTDYWRWTGDGLRRIVTQAGLEVQRTSGIGNLAAAGIQLLQDASARYVYRRFRPLYSAAMQHFAAVACRLTGGDSDKDAMVFVVTAMRPRSADA